MREPLYGYTPSDYDQCPYCGAPLFSDGPICLDCMDAYDASFEDWKDL